MSSGSLQRLRVGIQYRSARPLEGKYPDKKFTFFGYGPTGRIPSHLRKVPDDVVIGFTQTAAGWSLPERAHELANRKEWIAAMNGPEQLLIWEYYLHTLRTTISRPCQSFSPRT